jgi:hypothetical protein
MDILKRGEYLLTLAEKERVSKILTKAVAKADGVLSPNEISLTEDNPEGCKIFSIIFEKKISLS